MDASITEAKRLLICDDITQLNKNSCDNGAQWNAFIERIKIFSDIGNIRGLPSAFGVVDLVFADFPTSIQVNGIDTGPSAIPSWNVWSNELCDTAFSIAENITVDSGWFVTLHSVEHICTIDDMASSWEFVLHHRLVIHNHLPLGWTLSEPRTKVHLLILSAYSREGFGPNTPNFEDVPKPRGGWVDLVQDRCLTIEWIEHEGKPLRGSSQRSHKVWDLIVMLFSKPRHLVVDLMCGTGTLLKIASLRGRFGIGLDNDQSLPLDFLESI